MRTPVTKTTPTTVHRTATMHTIPTIPKTIHATMYTKMQKPPTMQSQKWQNLQ